MPKIRLDQGLSVHCAVDDYLWPWEAPIPVLMMHGFAPFREIASSLRSSQ